jgi:hypothetical protein
LTVATTTVVRDLRPGDWREVAAIWRSVFLKRRAP